MNVMVLGCAMANFCLVSHHRGSGNAGSEDPEASDGGEA